MKSVSWTGASLINVDDVKMHKNDNIEAICVCSEHIVFVIHRFWSLCLIFKSLQVLINYKLNGISAFSSFDAH